MMKGSLTEVASNVADNKRKKLKAVRLSAMLLAAAFINPATPMPVQAQTLSCPGSLLFGDYTTCASAETATVTPTGSRSTTGCLTAGGAPVNNGYCVLTSTATLPTPIHLSVTAASYTISNGTAQKMTVDNFACIFQASATTNTGACSFSTTGYFMSMSIGADLNVNNPQAAGSYSGTFTVNSNFP